MDNIPAPQCGMCGGLSEHETARQKFGWEENDTFLPGAANDLVVVRDLKPGSSRRREVRQCPQCGAYFLYESDYEYLVNGSEDEESLQRLTQDEAGKYLEGYSGG